MRHAFSKRFFLAAPLPLIALAAPAFANDAAQVIISATRSPVPTAEVGSSVSVVTAEDVEKMQSWEAIDALKRLPGVTFERSGGFGSLGSIRIRGSQPGQVKVLIDGIELNDATATGREFDFATLFLPSVDRIEVLRGPQSALYGNDAMAGVVNLFTDQGGGKPRASAEIEGGSYRTHRERITVAGGGDRANVSITAFDVGTAGFNRIRVGTEKDGADAQGALGRFGYQISDTLRVDATLGHTHLDSAFDPSTTQDGPARQRTDVSFGRIATTFDALDGRLRTTVQASGSRTDRSYNQPLGWYDRSSYLGTQGTVGFQSTLAVRGKDQLLFGVERRSESAEIRQSSKGIPTPDFDASNGTTGGFVQYRLVPVDDLFFTIGGRHDHDDTFGGHTTGRVTAAYILRATGTTFRASAGTGAKAPSLYQLFEPNYGNANLQVETSIGVDAGIEQRLLGDRLTLGVTGFHNRFDNLIDFDLTTYRYVNAGRAQTQGVEVTADWRVIDTVRLTGSYTFMVAENLDTGLRLPRRPRHTGSAGVDWTPTAKASLGAEITALSNRLNSTYEPGVETPGFGVVNLRASYELTKNITAFGRLENLFDRDYQEVRGYRTPGRSVYVGLRGNL